ncbi:hypothetical protein ACXPVS_23730, partial [Pseudomonas sp. Ma2-10]
PWMKRFMGDPYDEVLRNHSKGSRKRFYTLWADFCPSPPAAMPSYQSIMVTDCAGHIRNKSVVRSHVTAWSSGVQFRTSQDTSYRLFIEPRM